MKIKPIGERVLLKTVEIETKTKSGIVLPDTISQDKENIGQVIAIGTGEKLAEIAIGQKVIYSKFSGTEIKDNSETFLLLDIENILAVVED